MAILLAAAALLWGCRAAETRAPFTDSRVPPGLESRFLPPQGWAWGLVQPVGLPAARYGVSGPASGAKADILILTSYGESAEVWYETTRDLNAKGYAVWVLEPVGQGGSGHYSRLRDLGYAESLTPDVLTAKAMAETVIHRRPLILMASGTSAPVGIQAIASGTAAEGLILTSPRLQPDDLATLGKAHEIQARGLGWLRADLHGGWSRRGPDDRMLGLTHDQSRGKVRLAWQTANPDLRMGSPSWSWITAFADAVQVANRDEQRLVLPVLMLEPDRARHSARADCQRMPHCTFQPVAGADQALELEADAWRTAWLTKLAEFTAKSADGFSPPPGGARLPRGG